MQFNNMMLPPKLKKGDEIRIVAPAKSLSVLGKNAALAKKHLEKLGFKVTYSKHVREKDILESSSIESRVSDLHDAFADKNVKAILVAVGGFSSNDLLKYIDYDLIKKNPKIFCGYSDITAISNAITAKTGLITYSGLCFSNFAMQQEYENELQYFKKCLLTNSEFDVKPSKTWSNDKWYSNQNKRNMMSNEGYWIINKGVFTGKIIGGNLCTLNLLQGTEFMPSLKNTILFLEDDCEVDAATFNRDLQSIIHLPDFKYVKGIVIGRFEKESDVTREEIEYAIKTKKELKNIPVNC
jgi:muramoyltetrapeptide carboxypeptidase